MSSERIRLFVALELPAEIRQALVRWRSDAPAVRAKLRLLAPEHLHVTLCFLGWQSTEAVGEIAAACLLAEDRDLRLALEEPVWLPPRRPRVLAVGLHDNDGHTAQLQSELSQRLAAGGWYEPERRAYLPHATVARVKGRSSVRPVELPGPPPLEFRAPSITLYRSRLSQAGARYEALASVDLG